MTSCTSELSQPARPESGKQTPTSSLASQCAALATVKERQRWCFPKDGETKSEDFVAISEDKRTIAVADGAGMAIFSREWAEVLVNYYVAHPTDRISPEWLDGPQRAFEEMYRGRQLPWYTRAKLQQGSFASLLGLQIDPSARRWRAIAIGDTCLIHVTRGQRSTTFPLSSVSAFCSNPVLVPSSARVTQTCLCQQETVGGKLRTGDLFILATDAMSEWLFARLGTHEGRQPRPWTRLLRVKKPAAFLAQQRLEGALRNDDITLVILEIGGE